MAWRSSSLPGTVALAPGVLIGSTETHIETPSFVFGHMNGSVPAREVPRHTHETAYFFVVLQGDYAAEARNATGPCGPFTVIFNPSGTTHRDHFLEAGGQFLAVHLSRGLEREMESAVPISSV